MRNIRPRSRWEYCAGWIVAMFCVNGTSVQAAEPRETERQTREFKISVDGKPCGSSTVKISRRDDESEVLRGKSEVKVNILAHPYTYSSTSSETWKDGKLIEKETAANYNGKRYAVKAIAAANGMQVTVNGEQSLADTGLWVTSYWQLPERLELPATGLRTVDATGKPGVDAEARSVVLLDSDQGRILEGELECVGVETIKVVGRSAKCTHYRITGDVQVDVWYDASRRMVRQESMEWRHKTVLELARIANE